MTSHSGTVSRKVALRLGQWQMGKVIVTKAGWLELDSQDYIIARHGGTHICYPSTLFSLQKYNKQRQRMPKSM